VRGEKKYLEVKFSKDSTAHIQNRALLYAEECEREVAFEVQVAKTEVKSR